MRAGCQAADLHSDLVGLGTLLRANVVPQAERVHLGTGLPACACGACARRHPTYRRKSALVGTCAAQSPEELSGAISDGGIIAGICRTVTPQQCAWASALGSVAVCGRAACMLPWELTSSARSGNKTGRGASPRAPFQLHPSLPRPAPWRCAVTAGLPQAGLRCACRPRCLIWRADRCRLPRALLGCWLMRQLCQPLAQHACLLWLQEPRLWETGFQRPPPPPPKQAPAQAAAKHFRLQHLRPRFLRSQPPQEQVLAQGIAEH